MQPPRSAALSEPLAPTRDSFVGSVPAHSHVGDLDANRRRSFAYSRRGPNMSPARLKSVNSDPEHHRFLAHRGPTRLD